ncbi:WD40/YVTN/BNR-like repeat-containing protein [Dysosmobacter sp.]
MAGRDTVKTWAEVTPAFTQLEMVSADDGWLVLSIGHGIGGMDTYSYRTHDGGKTWAGASPLPENAWLPDKCAFLDGLHAVVTTKVFQGAPVFATNDGGKTWLEIALPLPKDQTVQPVDLRLSGGGLYLTMAWNSPGGAHQTITLSSRDLGQTWSADEPR